MHPGALPASSSLDSGYSGSLDCRAPRQGHPKIVLRCIPIVRRSQSAPRAASAMRPQSTTRTGTSDSATVRGLLQARGRPGGAKSINPETQPAARSPFAACCRKKQVPNAAGGLLGDRRKDSQSMGCTAPTLHARAATWAWRPQPAAFVPSPDMTGVRSLLHSIHLPT